MDRYLVISYNSNTQETFVDTVAIDRAADDPYSDARALIDTVRPDAIAVYCFTVSDLHSLADEVESTSLSAIRESIQKLSEATETVHELAELGVMGESDD